MASESAYGARRRAERAGRTAETLAAWLLRLKGYRILARRFRTPAGEIDVIARRGGTIAFVEVKRRGFEDEALEAIGRSERRLRAAAEAWLARNPASLDRTLRFDAVLVIAGRLPRHMTGIFVPE